MSDKELDSKKSVEKLLEYVVMCACLGPEPGQTMCPCALNRVKRELDKSRIEETG